ncbi:Cbb3-type cytochrome oxidase component FixQ [Pigmentiphaga humi]|uniref:Cbb3-type cytochrome oxidase component FixQ n=1 Tax=Pigmentiphaga humi TaxID=2478468 RepID=A0A3P4AX86_9BURK|nr:CcoQ/FixQ family Cbb3-type cytochrome c oxidase assembly chaperone [Pigmentiphaga humi]VCU68372.1 Cbb3-type cytochrome oxidase component FixQ [Pigmentiphaga humi]
MASLMISIATVVSLLTFLGIVAWAWSGARAQANRESALLPFALPEESAVAAHGEERAQ